MPSTIATARVFILGVLAQHSQAFYFAPSPFHGRVPNYCCRTSSGNFEGSPSSTTTAVSPPSYRHDGGRRSILQAGAATTLARQTRRGLMMMSDAGGSSGGGGGFGGGDGWFSAWKRNLVAASVALSVLSGSTWVHPAGTPLAVTHARAAMAPSLMQDEKGYISIFEKV